MAPGSLLLLTLAAVSLSVLHLLADVVTAASSSTITARTTIPKYSLLQSTGPAPRMPREKLSHLRFFWHDIYSGTNPTAVQVAQAPTTATSRTGFGTVAVIDDPMTEGPELTSRLVGRAQGMYTAASSKDTVALLMAQTFAFTEGKYNGSSLTVLGRNPVFSAVREMPIVGGSGLFRWARGYVQARTHTYDVKTGDATVEYNVYAIHY